MMRAGIVLLSTLLLVDAAAAFTSAPCSALRKITGSIGHTPLHTPSSISPRCLAARRPTRMAETSAYEVVPCTRRFEFVPYGEKYSGGEKSICVDGLVLGADLDLSHWMNNKTPTEYKADLSTEIVFKWLKIQAAAKYPSREFLNAVVLNNHFDTDGLMSAWALLEPEKALDYESAMVSAAGAGDFGEWGLSDRGMILDIVFSKLGKQAGSDKAAYEELLPKVEELLKSIPKQPHLWKDEMDELDEAFDLVCDDIVTVSRLADKKTKFTHAQGEVGDIGILSHPKGVKPVPGPVISRTFSPVMKTQGKSVGRILLAMEQDGGCWSYVYQRPGYAWADTVTRPICTKPNAALLVEQLGAPWTADVASLGMTVICKTLEPVSYSPDEMADMLLTFERGILPRGLASS